MTAQQLKNSILQLAVQGKLVPQDPDDEPASDLLERIRTERQKLIREGKIKKGKSLPPITDDELPFNLPESWEWVRLEMLSVNIHYGYTASAAETGNAKLLRITDIQDSIVQWESVPFCSPSDREFSVYGLQNRDIMIARTGGTIGKSYIVRNLKERAVFASYLIRVIPFQAVCQEYIKIFLETPMYWEQLKERSMGTGQPNVNGQSLKALILPLPPLAEQHRIVERIEQLLPHLAEYDTAEQKLTTLNAKFPDQLKKSILQSAVQGKLVPQDEKDEPASVLLERIQADKEQLIKDGKLKKQKPLQPIIDDEIPFDVPESWEWVRLGDVGTFIRGSGIKRSETTEHGFPCVRYGELYTTYDIAFDKAVSFTSKSIADKAKEITYGDILMTLTGEKKAEIGKAVAFVGLEKTVIGGDMTIFTNHMQNPKFLAYLLNSPYAITTKTLLATGNIIVHISNEKLSSIIIPLPPLAEQERILETIEATFERVDSIP